MRESSLRHDIPEPAAKQGLARRRGSDSLLASLASEAGARRFGHHQHPGIRQRETAGDLRQQARSDMKAGPDADDRRRGHGNRESRHF
jgi:hypothetical protein